MAPYGSRLLPQALDEHASTSPTRLYASVPRSNDLSQGFQDVTCQDMARCVNFMAHWIIERYGSSSSFETIAYIGIPDLRSMAVFLGAVKAGYKVLLPSPRNPPTTNLSLMEQTGCTRILHTSEVSPVVKNIQSHRPSLLIAEILTFQVMLQSDAPAFPYEKDFEKVKNDPIVVLHSSGSTGMPKPIIMTHATLAVLDNERNLPKVPGRRNRDYSVWDFKDGGRFYTIFPYFHLAGFLCLTVNPIFTEQSSPVLGPPLLPPSGALLKEVMQHQRLRALYLPPSVAEQLLLEPNGLEYFKDLDFLAYTGAPFSPSAGKQLSTVTELCPLYGSTEAFQVPQLAPATPEDWAWMEWNPCFKVEMQRSEDEPEAFELVLFADESTAKISALNHNMPGISEYRTKDLFKQHPHKPRLWQYHGRRDDIVVLSNGEKFNPVPLELAMQSHPLLSGALVVGMGRAQAALLAELKSESIGTDLAVSKDMTAIREEVWQQVEQANKLLPAQGRIMKDMILLSTAQKSFVRAGKGTVVRKLTEQLYEKEVQDLYSSIAQGPSSAHAVSRGSMLAVRDTNAVREHVRRIVRDCFPEMSDLTDQDSFFDHGLDSIKMTYLTAELRWSLELEDDDSMTWLNTGLISKHPSIEGLTDIIWDWLSKRKVPTNGDTNRAAEMQNFVHKYTQNIPEMNAAQRTPRTTTTVAVLGSTGFLGPHIVASLLKGEAKSTIYCLNRGADAQERTTTSLTQIGVFVQEDLDRLRWLQINFGSPNFALDDSVYNDLRSTVDAIIINVWNPNFSLPLHVFEPFFKGLRTTIDWCTTSPRHPSITFISSIAGVGNWPMAYRGEHIDIPELPAQDGNVAYHMGYGESKCIAEMILAHANTVSAIPVSIVRAGQIGGPSDTSTSGAWPVQGWLLDVITASRRLGSFPAHISPLDWIPVDVFAAGIARLAQTPIPDHNAEKNVRVYNMVHPNPSPWGLFLDTLRNRFGLQASEVSLPAWLELCHKYADQPDFEDGIIGMLTFLQSLGEGVEGIGCATQRAASVLDVVPPLDEDLLASWLSHWQLNLGDVKGKI